jgi:hypothetical protein
VRHGRRDGTHAEVRDGLREVFGAKAVHDTADVGNGFPDLVLGCHGLTILLEVKRDKKAHLTDDQIVAMTAWRGGPWLVVVSFADALAKVGVELRKRGIAAPRMAA